MPYVSDGQLRHLKCSTRRYCAVQVDLNPEPLTQAAQHGVRKVDEERVSAACSVQAMASFIQKHLLQVELSCPLNSVGYNE